MMKRDVFSCLWKVLAQSGLCLSPASRQKPNGSAERLLGEEEVAKGSAERKEVSSPLPAGASAPFSFAE